MDHRVIKKKPNVHTIRPGVPNSSGGFSLFECVIALLILCVISLSVGSVLSFSRSNSENAKKRHTALLLAQQRMEDVRNTEFANLAAAVVTENDVLLDGVLFTVVRTITQTDVINSTAAPGPETKQILVEVTPKGTIATNLAWDKVSLTTVRGVNRPGPNRIPNP